LPLASPIHNRHLSNVPPIHVSCDAEDAFSSHSLAMTQALRARRATDLARIIGWIKEQTH